MLAIPPPSSEDVPTFSFFRHAMHLVSPSVEFEATYLSYLAELGDQPRIPFPLTFPAQPFAALVSRLNDASRGFGLPDGFVAHSTHWLIGEGQLLGVSNLRHALTPALQQCGGHIGYGVRPSAQGRGVGKVLLRQTLLKAEAMGIARVLLTCAKDNVPSSRIILANGGVLGDEIVDPQTDRPTFRYWIDIALSEG